ncbi:MAG: hypothetical protein RMY29_008735 [Nostoc sp. CreGUA01]|nr:hypothetical protein [Nostoc sp. CreGUA01]
MGRWRERRIAFSPPPSSPHPHSPLSPFLVNYLDQRLSILFLKCKL